jgi:hypothetical protein
MAAFGASSAPVERGLPGAATLSLLSEIAGDRPLLPRILDGVGPIRLRLVATTPYRSGVVWLRYRPDAAAQQVSTKHWEVR